jgi:tetrahydromethanopterin S-methyltransferase subunit G
VSFNDIQRRLDSLGEDIELNYRELARRIDRLGKQLGTAHDPQT